MRFEYCLGCKKNLVYTRDKILGYHSRCTEEAGIVSYEQDHGSIDEDVAYLENFWKPVVGSKVKWEGAPKRIAAFPDMEYPTQVQLEGSERIHYLQDLKWVPSTIDYDEMLRDFGWSVSKDSLRLGRVFYPRPETPNEYASAIRQARQLGIMSGKDALLDYF